MNNFHFCRAVNAIIALEEKSTTLAALVTVILLTGNIGINALQVKIIHLLLFTVGNLPGRWH